MALKRSSLTPLVAANLGLLPVESLNGPVMPESGRDPCAPREESGEDVSYWDVEMGSDVVQ